MNTPTILFSLLMTLAQPAPDVALSAMVPPSTALIGLDADALAGALRASGATALGATVEQCSAQLTVEDGFGRRITIPRGQWVTIDNGCRQDLIWFCGATREISRGVRGRRVFVFPSTTSRRIDIRW